LGGIGGFLVRKLVNPTKVFCSGAPHEARRGKVLPPQTEFNVRAGTAGILREPNAAVRQELSGLNSTDGFLD
jgi:hypothetical protein